MDRRSASMRRAARHGSEGQSLIIAIILLVVAAILVIANIYFLRQSSRHSSRHSQIIRERYLAEAGLQYTLHRLNTDEAFSAEIQNMASGQKNPFDTAAGPGSITWAGGTIKVVIEPY